MMVRWRLQNGTISRSDLQTSVFAQDLSLLHIPPRINRTFVISATSSMLFKPQIEYIYKDYFLDPERKQDRKAHGER